MNMNNTTIIIIALLGFAVSYLIFMFTPFAYGGLISAVLTLYFITKTLLKRNEK